MHFNSASSLKQQPGPRVDMSLPLDTHNPDTDPKSLCYYYSLILRDYLRSSKYQCCCLWFDLSENPTEHANNLNLHTQMRPLIINIINFLVMSNHSIIFCVTEKHIWHKLWDIKKKKKKSNLRLGFLQLTIYSDQL